MEGVQSGGGGALFGFIRINGRVYIMEGVGEQVGSFSILKGVQNRGHLEEEGVE